MFLTSIDPGTHGCGVAVWENEILSLATYIPAIDKRSWTRTAGDIFFDTRIPTVCAIAIEFPQIYKQSLWKGDPNDLTVLAGVVGGICALADGPVAVYKPSEWKKRLPKDIHHPRILSKLSAEEKIKFEMPKDKKKQLDVLDAVGIGLFHLKRMR